MKLVKPLTKKLKERWVKALRSGRYRQGTGALHKLDNLERNTYCCLGVLQKISREKSIKNNTWLNRESSYEDPTEYVFLPRMEQRELAMMNDDKKSFVEIADYIEKHIDAE